MSYKTEASWERNNTFKILVATDIHLGYGEKDPLRGTEHNNLKVFLFILTFLFSFFKQIKIHS